MAETSRYWRVRMNYAGQQEFSSQAWAANEVGIWYGGWTTDEYRQALGSADALAFLSKVPQQARHTWRLVKNHLDTVHRFNLMQDGDWVVVAFDGALHLGRLCGPMCELADHALNRTDPESGGLEYFHYRPIASKKTFRLSDLPDSFRLIQTSGRQMTVNQFQGTRSMVAMLAECESADEVWERIHGMSLRGWIDVLGPTGWESFCLGYLIVREGFVPTGLRAGGTLRAFDILGRRLDDGTRIIAQCKKNPDPEEVDSEFIAACQGYDATTRAFYFAYGSSLGPVPETIRVVDWPTVEAAIATDARVREFVNVFRGR